MQHDQQESTSVRRSALLQAVELTMKATPEGRSSCSEGKKAGPFRLLELLADIAAAEVGRAFVPATEVIAGDAMSS